MVNILLLIGLPLLLQSGNDTLDSQWKALEYFTGTWRGNTTGKAGEGKGEREYRFIMKGTYLMVSNLTHFPPQEKNPEGEVHEDVSYFSRDKGRKKIMLRQFNIEGFINRFVLDSLSADGKTWRFQTEASENAPPGMIARLIYSIQDKNHFTERFELGFPGREFSCFMTNTWERVR
jgi:hypothetical protein